MPDENEHNQADEETLPATPLHAYKEGREEDVEGDLDKLKSGDPDDAQRDEIEAEGESSGDHIEPPPKQDASDAS